MCCIIKASTCLSTILRIVWNTRRVQSLFINKDRNQHPSCVIYEGTCTCGKSYIGETKRNAASRWKEHTNPKLNSEPAKHLYQFPDHVFTWRVLLQASTNSKIRKAQEAYLIVLNRPVLNEQIDNNLILFRNGITWVFQLPCDFTFIILCFVHTFSDFIDKFSHLHLALMMILYRKAYA